jgi:hypothetical protein
MLFKATAAPHPLPWTRWHITPSALPGLNTKAFLMADLPFASYGDPYLALESAAELMRAGADMVKLEGGGDWQVEIITHLVERSVPVCAHLGLLPQSVHLLGGYKVQGKNKDAAVLMLEQAQACAAAGAQLLVLEAIPSALGKKITEVPCRFQRLASAPGQTAQAKYWYCRICSELVQANRPNSSRILWKAGHRLRLQ